MRKILIAAALLSMTSVSAFAQAGTPQGDTNVPNPPASASSNDMSKSPGASMPGATTNGKCLLSGFVSGFFSLLFLLFLFFCVNKT